MHPRNRHQSRYDLQKLIRGFPGLAGFVAQNAYGIETIDFTDAKAVKALNQAILAVDYGIKGWDFPAEALCPPVPGRADALHALADLIGQENGKRLLDIGTGATLIYPLIGAAEYGWNFVATDVAEASLKNAEIILRANPQLPIALRKQPRSQHIFQNVILPGEVFDASLCNPPFFASAAEARGTREKKWKKLGKSHLKHTSNFSGGATELWYPGGERAFVQLMIQESVSFKTQVKWFTTLVSKSENLTHLERELKKVSPRKREILEMEQGQKKSRLLAWSFF